MNENPEKCLQGGDILNKASFTSLQVGEDEILEKWTYITGCLSESKPEVLDPDKLTVNAYRNHALICTVCGRTVETNEYITDEDITDE